MMNFYTAFPNPRVPTFYYFRNGTELYHFSGGNLSHFRQKVDELRFKSD
ncbi:unnamed protein product [Staurois parvus]|uniref:Uncharacterized protein n=1 Tax=Staurois parvus TaxID=386267 RepID=A0ABN9FB19_9NEOB|nr:unnamed protein product [Staurois parvus]